MLRLVARVLIDTLTPRSCVSLGELLITAGRAAEAKYAAVAEAHQAVKAAIAKLTEK